MIGVFVAKRYFEVASCVRAKKVVQPEDLFIYAG